MALPFRFVITLPFLILLLYFLFYCYHVGRCIIIITTVVFLRIRSAKIFKFYGST